MIFHNAPAPVHGKPLTCCAICHPEKHLLKQSVQMLCLVLICSPLAAIPSSSAMTAEPPAKHAAKAHLLSCAGSERQPVSISKIDKNHIATLANGQQLLFANIKITDALEGKYLDDLFANSTVTLAPSGRLTDRHNRLIRQVILKPKRQPEGEAVAPLWLQQHLVREGRARVYALPSNYLCVKELLESEHQARLAGKGEWRQGGAFQIHPASAVKLLNRLPQGSFQIVRGRLKAVSINSRSTYLNFSDDWKSDFTAMLDSRLLKRKDSRWPHLKSLISKTVLIRGWLDHWNGPMIRLETPEMLTVEAED